MSTKRIQLIGSLPKPDWAQTDETKNDYIKNKPPLGILASQDEVAKEFLSADVQDALTKADSAEQTYETKADAIVKLDTAKAHADSNLEVAKAYADEQVANMATYISDSREEIDAALSNKSDLDHDHNDVYDAVGTAQTKADEALVAANAYTDAQTSGFASESSIATSIDTHNESDSSHNDIRVLINELTNNKVNVDDIINNLESDELNKPLSAAQGAALKALIDAITVPTKVSELDNDSGYITSYTETDPTVPAWAKEATKPTYTASEVGADASGSASAVQNNLDTHIANTANPHGVALSHLGITATANELNYMDGVTSNVQTQLDGKAASSHTHDASNITSGTLSVSCGGTGATNASAARTNLGIKTETWTFTLENGSTVTKAVYVG